MAQPTHEDMSRQFYRGILLGYRSALVNVRLALPDDTAAIALLEKKIAEQEAQWTHLFPGHPVPVN